MWLLELIEGCIAFLISGFFVIGVMCEFYLLCIIVRRIARALDR